MNCAPHRARWVILLVSLAMCVAIGLIIFFVTRQTNPPPGIAPECQQNCLFVSHEQWTNVLEGALRPTATRRGVDFRPVDYDAVRNNANFSRYVQMLERIDISNLTNLERKALFINAYNALAMKMVLDNPCSGGNTLCDSIRSVNTKSFASVWVMPAGTIGGEVYSLDNIEHDYLRRAFPDPRLHAAVNCASVSCPDLRSEAYTAAKLEEQLEDQARVWLGNPTKGLSLPAGGSPAKLSSLFNWYGGDFNKPSIASFLGTYGPYGSANAALEPPYDWLAYDWGLNAAGV